MMLSRVMSDTHQDVARSLGDVSERPDYRDDALLLAAIKRGDATALHTVTARYGGQLLAYANSKLPRGEEATAESIVADALLALWRRASKLTESHLRGFLFKVARDGIADFYRKRERQPKLVGQDPVLAEDDAQSLRSWLAREQLNDVVDVINAMKNPIQQDVLLLTATGKSDREIAAELTITPTSARQHRKRGRAELRAALKHEDDD